MSLDELRNTTLPDLPPGIEGDTTDLPEPWEAIKRVREYVTEFGDGLYDVTGGAPLYGRDLEAICRALHAVLACKTCGGYGTVVALDTFGVSECGSCGGTGTADETDA